MTHRRVLQATITAAACAAAMALAAPAAHAADLIIDPPVVDDVKAFSGWYIRGDFGYSFNDQDDEIELEPIGVCDPLAGCVLLGEPGFDDYHVGDSVSFGVGVGAHLNQYVRFDMTADFHFGGDFEATLNNGINGGDPVDLVEFESDYNAITVMTNLYADMGTYAGITPYVGAGIGFAHVNYDEVVTRECLAPPVPSGSTLSCNSAIDPTAVVEEKSMDGESSLRLAWSLSAGAAYNINESFAIDGGYRFTRIDDGPILDKDGSTDGGFDMHQIRIGARYKFH